MTDALTTWREDLVERWPKLFQDAARRDAITVGAGWQGIIEQMLQRMMEVVETSVDSAVEIGRIETKYGTMRVDGSFTSTNASIRSEFEVAADLAEARSGHTCECCGAEGRLRESRLGWQITRCDLHAGEAIEITSDQSEVFVRRSFDHGRLTIASCRRYVRSQDRFIDIDPRSVGLEE